ncbi:hypothetical protein EBZ97_03130 [bacterium]|nr:hypothetical protein [bacterium]
MVTVPLLDLGPQNEALAPAYESTFKEVMKSNAFIMGPRLEASGCQEADCKSLVEGGGSFAETHGAGSVMGE